MPVVWMHNFNLLPSHIFFLLHVRALIHVKPYISPSFLPNRMRPWYGSTQNKYKKGTFFKWFKSIKVVVCFPFLYLHNHFYFQKFQIHFCYLKTARYTENYLKLTVGMWKNRSMFITVIFHNLCYFS